MQKVKCREIKLKEDKMSATARKVEERDKLTIYIPKSLLKRFKKYAIEVEKDYSNLAELAFLEYLEKYDKIKT